MPLFKLFFINHY